MQQNDKNECYKRIKPKAIKQAYQGLFPMLIIVSVTQYNGLLGKWGGNVGGNLGGDSWGNLVGNLGGKRTGLIIGES